MSCIGNGRILGSSPSDQRIWLCLKEELSSRGTIWSGPLRLLQSAKKFCGWLVEKDVGLLIACSDEVWITRELEHCVIKCLKLLIICFSAALWLDKFGLSFFASGINSIPCRTRILNSQGGGLPSSCRERGRKSWLRNARWFAGWFGNIEMA